jgi:brefeldin A-inhibited guanine nucleotide-exchange protein
MFSFGATTEKTAATPVHQTTAGGSTDMFIKSALEQLANAKEAKRLNQLRDAVKNGLSGYYQQDILIRRVRLHVLDLFIAALEMPSPDLNAIQTILQPLQIACQSRQPALIVIAIDCLGKLFTYNYWGRHNIHEISWDDGGAVANEFDEGAASVAPTGGSTPNPARTRKDVMDDDRDDASESGGGGIIKHAIDTICDTFSGGENTDEKVQLQIVKALLAAVSSVDPVSCIHGGVLLRAIRTTYNIFLLSRSANTQIVAQATLTQMVQAVFGRVPKNLQQQAQKPEITVVTHSADAGSPTVSPSQLEIASASIEIQNASSPVSTSDASLPSPNAGQDNL